MRTLPLSIAAVALLAAPLLPIAAQAATTPDTTRAFCTQLQTSQTAIGAIPATAKNRFTLISSEWTKMARFAPTAIKNDVNAIAAAYKTANGQTAAVQKTTLSKITKSAQNVTAFTTKSCAAGGEGSGGGDGPGGGRFAALGDCVAKKGGKLPERVAGGGGTGGGNGGGANGGGRGAGGFGTVDAATQKALDACRTELGLGAGGGGGGRGGVRNNPELTACLKKKGITLPTAPAPQSGQAEQGQAGQQRQAANRQQFDAKTQAAIDACRKELGLPAGGQRNGVTPSSTVKR